MEYKLEILSYLLIFKKKNERIAKFDEQIKTCINIFEKVLIDEEELAYLFEKNILDINPCVRSLCWKLALKHLSLNTSKWNEELCEKKKLYEDYIKCFILNPPRGGQNGAEGVGAENEAIAAGAKLGGDDPNEDTPSTNLDDDSDANFINSELFSQINKDTFRTRPELSFFNLNPQQTINNNVKILNSLISIEEFEEDVEEEIPSLVNINEMTKGPSDETEYQTKNVQHEKEETINGMRIEHQEENEEIRPLVDEISEKFTTKSKKDEKICQQKINYEHSFGDHSADVCDIVNPKRHYDLLCRILFIYAKIHPYVKYVQGMNEILAPLYFIIFNDPLCNCSIQGEADTFFCFVELMQKQKDIFCEGLDNTDDGINGKLKKFSLLLRIKEYELWKKLYTLKIETQYYALKWILLLLTQEFDMADTIILYDHFIINNDENFILYICLVICAKLKSSLLCGNFTVNLKLLQNIPPFDPYDIIYEAKSLMSQDFKNGFNITDVYNQYYGQRKRINSLGSLQNCSSIAEEDISSFENLYGMDEGESGPRRGSILNSLRNKSIVQNIKNYISNKMDMAKRENDDLDFDEL
ncbi:TBC domain protein, putative [Plasmodium knowlesi strain H]|uniref:TBC domain protein, putative n=3 Tax=Plasmodium knowlesi TaxID=5850 RepID=A0A5K1TV05_PLAKH|nr:uncharacterized protein PKNH_1420800 [Plasmodium knowlesi strain H]OTN64220.1 putative TBC domain protein [Plasmodium knowlesi]CAA9990808.1 TBC domain protein, putative [Plasmodium knowlesi strain H]SBO21029.1 TBC domain protein, putative [Plasmodium knowlesi strain H]SBO21521.1 TBC domain protein, putative [Plasmodium knowlesi strain H]VVS80282.1 TBC domain protein, putative [Plasmodium knowlesi strain H]|eukprot:XP_002262096.1 [Plasmodium knowlesi strain H]